MLTPHEQSLLDATLRDKDEVMVVPESIIWQNRAVQLAAIVVCLVDEIRQREERDAIRE